MITDSGQEALDFNDVITEICDIASPATAGKITLKDLINWWVCLSRIRCLRQRILTFCCAKWSRRCRGEHFNGLRRLLGVRKSRCCGYSRRSRDLMFFCQALQSSPARCHEIEHKRNLSNLSKVFVPRVNSIHSVRRTWRKIECLHSTAKSGVK